MIEHIEDDVSAVRGLARVLAPEGVLVITVPAGQWLWSRHDERNGHYRRYDRRRLRALLEGAGLRVRRMTGFNTLLLPVVAGVRVGGRLLGLDAAGTGVPPSPVNAALVKLLGMESRLLRRLDLPLGVSLAVVATRA